MAVSGTNQVKNVVNPVGQSKAGVYLWGDPLYTWGDPIATWGGLSISPVNQVKNIIDASTDLLWSALTLPWQEALPWQFTSSATQAVNQIKN